MRIAIVNGEIVVKSLDRMASKLTHRKLARYIGFYSHI